MNPIDEFFHERREDIPMLTEHFLQLICQDHGIPKKAIDAAAIDALRVAEEVLRGHGKL